MKLIPRLAFVLILTGIIVSPEINAQTADTIYYWVRPGNLRRQGTNDQSFVIPVSSAQAAEIEAIKQDGGRVGAAGDIVAGPGGFNKNYLAPGQPAWNWHFTSITGIYDLRTTAYIACVCPFL